MTDLNTIIAELADATARNDVAAFEKCAADFEALDSSEGTIRAVITRAQVALMRGEPTHALKLNEEALRLSEAHDLPLLAAKARSGIGNAYRSLGQLERALEYHRQTLGTYEQLGGESGLASANHNVGLVLYDMGHLAESVGYFRRAMEIHEQTGAHASLARVTGLLGCVYGDSGQTAEGLELLFRALEQHEKNGDDRSVFQVLNNIGTIYFSMGRDEEALEYYLRTLTLMENASFRADAAMVHANVGSTLAELGRTQEAITQLERAIAMHTESGNVIGLSTARCHMASVCFRNGDLAQAQTYVDAYADTAPSSVFTQLPWRSLKADLLIARNELEAAQTVLEGYLSLAEASGVRGNVATAHGMLRDLALKRNDLQAYVHHNTEAVRIAEEVSGRAVTQRLTIMEADRRFERERQEREKERALLYGALPESVATRMLSGEDVSGDHFDNASVLFLDIVGFTTISDRIPPGHVVHLLKAIFRVCDDVCTTHGLTKIKTIGDSYLAVAGVPDPLDDHATRAALAACDMMRGLNNLELTMDPKLGDTSWTNDVGEITVRIGLHCGPLVAGIVGEQRLQYDVWGDTVNVASRMESTGEPGRIHVSEAFNNSLTPCLPDSLTLQERGVVSIKGKGPMTTYWLEGAER